MKNKKRLCKGLVCLAVTGAMLLSAGCQQGKNIIFGEPETTEPVYFEDSTINIPIENVRTLNPLISKDEDCYQMSKLIYDGLFELDENLVPTPKLVESYNYDESGMNLTLNLKKNVQWHDGQAFNGGDVKFTIEAIMHLARYNLTLYSAYVENIRSVSVDRVDNSIVTISFRNRLGVGPENLIFPIVPSHGFRSVAAVNTGTSGFTPIGTGAYMLGSTDNFSHITLEPNPQYFGEKATSIMKFWILPDREYAANMTRAGEISILYNKAADRDTLMSKHSLTHVSYVSNEMEMIGFNFRNKHLSKKEVRQAIAHTMDLSALLAKAYYKNGIITDSIYFPTYYGAESGEDPYPQDVAAVHSSLLKAGYEDEDRDGFLESLEGEELYLEILINKSNQSRAEAAGIIKKEFDKVGIASTIITVEDADYYGRIANGNYDMYIGGYKMDERYDLRPLLHSAFRNPVAYQNPDMDAGLEKMVSAISITEKKAEVAKVKEMLVEDIPYYCLFYKTYGCFMSEFFDGIPSPRFNDIYYGCENWKCKYPEGFWEFREDEPDAEENTEESENNSLQTQ